MQRVLSVLLTALMIAGLGCASIDPIPEEVFDPNQDSGSADFGVLLAFGDAWVAGFGGAFHFDPIVLSADIDADLVEYMEVIDRLLDRVPANSISWVSLGLLRYPPNLPEHARRSFPDTRTFSGELVPVGGKVRYPKFMRSVVYKPLWERLAARLPAQKLYLCMETGPVWRKVDEGVSSSSCIEKRLCNMEFLEKS